MNRNSALFVLFVALLALSSPQKLMAKTDGAKECTHLQTLLGNLIEEYKEIKTPLKYNFDGELECEPTRSYYALTLPSLSISLANNNTMQVGIILINAKKGKQKNSWNFAFSLPSPITLKNKQDKTLLELSFNEQQNYAVWLENEKLLEKIDASLKNLIYDNYTNDTSAQISELQIQRNLTREKENFSGPSQIKAKNINITQLGGSRTNINEANIILQEKGYNPKTFLQNKEAIQNFITGSTNAEKQNTHIFKILSTLFEGFKITANYKNIDNYKELNTQTIEESTQNEVKTLHIDNANFSYEMQQLRNPTSDANLSINIENIAFPLLSNFIDILPTQMNIDWSAQNIPLEEIAQLAQENIEQQGILEGFTKINTLTKLPSILSNAKTKLTINNNTIGTKDYNLSLDGNMNADDKSKHNINGTITASINGLDTLIENIEQSLNDNPSDENRKNLQQALLQLTIIKGFAKTEKNSEEQTNYKYDFTIQPDGKILINNMDLSMLYTLMQSNKN